MTSQARRDVDVVSDGVRGSGWLEWRGEEGEREGYGHGLIYCRLGGEGGVREE